MSHNLSLTGKENELDFLLSSALDFELSQWEWSHNPGTHHYSTFLPWSQPHPSHPFDGNGIHPPAQRHVWINQGYEAEVGEKLGMMFASAWYNIIVIYRTNQAI